MIDAEQTAEREGVRDFQLFQQVLKSKHFERTPGLRKLLLFLWDSRHLPVSEYAIAMDALGRDANFDSRIDATVRVQIGRLRRLLARYYESDGALDERRLVIPVGSHQLQMKDASLTAATEASAIASEVPIEPESEGAALVPAASRSKISSWLVPAMTTGYIVIFVLAVAAFSLPGTRANLRGAMAPRQETPRFWKRFFDNGKSTRIVLPAPLFFSWAPSHSESLMVRDISVNDFDRSQDSPQLAELEKRLGKPGKWQNYTVASDTFASLQLARFLDRYGIQTSFSSSAATPHEITDHENIIAFGTVSSLVIYREQLDKLDFRMGVHERYVSDLRQPPDSPPPYQMVYEPGERVVCPGIVALLPIGDSGSRILLVQGQETTALISFLTSEDGMREIDRATQDFKSPYFEAVILSEVNRGTPIQSRLVAVRSYTVANLPVQPSVAAAHLSAKAQFPLSNTK